MQQETEKRNEAVVDNTDYIEAIKTLKENSVDRDKFDAVVADKKRLLDMVVNGQTIENVPQKSKADIKALRNKLYNTDNQLSNLDYVSTSLKLREALIEEGQPDPFLPAGHKVSVTQQDIDTAERVAAGLQQMVDAADGDPVIFLNEFQRRVKDTIPTKRR